MPDKISMTTNKVKSGAEEIYASSMNTAAGQWSSAGPIGILEAW